MVLVQKTTEISETNDKSKPKTKRKGQRKTVNKKEKSENMAVKEHKHPDD